MSFTYSDELSHHGVLGMKWGIRKQRDKKNKVRKKKKDKIKKNKAKKKSIFEFLKLNSSFTMNDVNSISSATQRMVQNLIISEQNRLINDQIMFDNMTVMNSFMF